MQPSTLERPPGMQRFKRPPGLTAHHLPPGAPPQAVHPDQGGKVTAQRRGGSASSFRSSSDRDSDQDATDDEAGDLGYDDDANEDFVRQLQQSCGYSDDQVRSLLAAYRVTKASTAQSTNKLSASIGTTSAEAKSGTRVPMPLPPPSAGVQENEAAHEKSERRRMQDQLDDLLNDISERKSSYDRELQQAREVIAKAQRDAAARAAAKEAERKARADAPTPLSLRLRDEHVIKHEREIATKAERERLKAEIKKFEEQEAARERREKGIASNLAIRKRIEAQEKLAVENPLASGKHDRVLGPRIGRVASGSRQNPIAPVPTDDALLELIAKALPPPPVKRNWAAELTVQGHNPSSSTAVDAL